MLLPYLYLILSSLCISVFSIVRKKYQNSNGISIKSTILFLSLYSLFVVFLSTICSLISFEIGNVVNISFTTVVLGLFIGIAVSITTFLCVVGTAFGSLSIMMMFAVIGQLFISSIYDLITKQTVISNHYIAALILIAIILILDFVQDKKNDSKTKNHFIFKIICAVIFFTNGSVLVLYNIFSKESIAFGQFNFITLYSIFIFVFSSLFLALILIKGRNNKDSQTNVKNFNWNNIFLISTYSVLFIASELFTLKTTSLIPVSIQSPLSFAISIITVTILDMIINKTKINTFQLLQMVAAILSAILISL